MQATVAEPSAATLAEHLRDASRSYYGTAARAFLAPWLTTYPRNAPLYSHLSWHLALGHLEAGDAAAALRLFTEAFSPDVHSGPPRAKAAARRSPLKETTRPVDGTRKRPDLASGCKHGIL